MAMVERITVEKKIKEYERFVEELKRDLRQVEVALTEKAEQHGQWEEVKMVCATAEEFDRKDRDMHLQVEIGCGVRALAEIADLKRVYVTIGLGCQLEMDTVEACKYSDIRLRALAKEISHFRAMAVRVKVNIKMTLLAIAELQHTLLQAPT